MNWHEFFYKENLIFGLTKGFFPDKFISALFIELTTFFFMKGGKYI